jgi:hypothetical protein
VDVRPPQDTPPDGETRTDGLVDLRPGCDRCTGTGRLVKAPVERRIAVDRLHLGPFQDLAQPQTNMLGDLLTTIIEAWSDALELVEELDTLLDKA